MHPAARVGGHLLAPDLSQLFTARPSPASCEKGVSEIQTFTATFSLAVGGRPSCSDRGLGEPSWWTFDHATASPARGQTESPSSGKWVSPPSVCARLEPKRSTVKARCSPGGKSGGGAG
eukprot:scaffold511_cov111-Isochrysis_galbana.AAC.5